MRDSIVFYKSFYDAIQDIPSEDQLKAYNMIFNYAFNDIAPQETGIPSAVFKLIKPQIDANNKRYENGKKGAEYGKLGGRPKKANPKETPNKPQRNPKETPNVNDNVNVNDIYTCADEPHDRKSEEQKLKDNFEILYKFYPKKVGKAKAFEYYRGWVSKNGRLVNGSRTHLENEQMYKAIKRYVQQQEDSNTELQYYKGFDTFMSKAILDYVEG